MIRTYIALAVLSFLTACGPQATATLANISTGLSVAQAGVNTVASSRNACDAIDNFAASAVSTGASCKIKNAMLNIQASTATACAIMRNGQSSTNNLSTASIIIASALLTAQNTHAQGC
jgi:hypothetical protein